MTTLDSLRKQYDKLTPFERASMKAEAIKSFDEAIMDALEPPSLWDHGATLAVEKIFLAVAFMAVNRARSMDTAYQGARAALAYGEPKTLEEYEAMKGSEWESRLERMFVIYKESERGRVAWALALRDLDIQVKGGMVNIADAFSDGFISELLDSLQGKSEPDYSKEMATLKEAYATITSELKDATWMRGHTVES